MNRSVSAAGATASGSQTTLRGTSSSAARMALDAHACRLRAKLSGGDRNYVRNTWGVGYRLFSPESEAGS